jgi:hypothetical protein
MPRMAERDDDIDGFFSTARVTGREGAVRLEGTDFHAHLYPLDSPELAPWRGMGYEEFTAARGDNPFLQELLAFWDALYAEPFIGVTSDGIVREGLYQLPQPHPDPALAAAAERALATLAPEERERFSYRIDAPEWRGWSNPEFVFHRTGLRLEDLEEPKAQAILGLIEASLSPAGLARLREAMALNGYLGELTGLPTVMNERSYWVALFGDPGPDGAWGWQLFGHHACVNFVTVGGRHVVAPVFLGGEPALADGREPLFAAREQVAIALASSLTPAQAERAVVYDSVLDPAMPEGRLHPADERHLAGAFRDNRVIPYEGIPATSLDDGQRGMLRAIAEDFLLLLRDDQRALTLADYDAHLDATWFSWYGATDGSSPFYFRIQSPVIVAELDHHAGVWLDNRLPARFHVHTTLRLPNGNDYAKAYLAQAGVVPSGG